METPLEVLGRLVGGYWRMEGDKSTTAYNVFTWGPGHRTLHGTFYRLGDGKNEDPVRAEAFYFWHTAKKKICGIAAGEEGEVYEGEYTIEGNTWTQDFQYHSAQGTSAFRETWEFPNNDTYVWTLYKKVNGSLEERMRATFRRGKEKPIAP